MSPLKYATKYFGKLCKKYTLGISLSTVNQQYVFNKVALAYKRYNTERCSYVYCIVKTWR